MSARKNRFQLLLIDPYTDGLYRLSRFEQRVLFFPKLSMPVIASATPGGWEVTFVDEAVTPITPEFIRKSNADLVGISVQMTCYAPRAYQLSMAFKAMGKKTVLGGIHVSCCPEEALQQCDAVVIGEAEGTWPRVCSDFERGDLAKVYRAEGFPSLNETPSPRYDILDPEGYMTTISVQSTRGCYHNCDFCSVSPYNGKQVRHRPVQSVIQDITDAQYCRWKYVEEKVATSPWYISLFSRMRGNIVAFVDDLHNSNPEYCRELWTELKSLNIKWGGQCTLALANDEEMVKLAAESGCVAMFVGMESIVPETIKGMSKSFNKIGDYAKQIRTFHDYGIMVNPGIIFGSDHEDTSVFSETVKFLIENKMELAYFNIATPLPGTRFYERLDKEGRIFDRNWAHYDGKHVVFHPQNMTVEELQQGFFWANHQFFSWPSIFKRLYGTRQRIVSRLIGNIAFHRIINRTMPSGIVRLEEPEEERMASGNLGG